MKIPLPDAEGRFDECAPRDVTIESRPLGPDLARTVVSAAHVVADRFADARPPEVTISIRNMFSATHVVEDTFTDGQPPKATPAFRRHQASPRTGDRRSHLRGSGMKIPLPDTEGRFDEGALRDVTIESRLWGPDLTRTVVSATHVVEYALTDDQPPEVTGSNRKAAAGFRRLPTDPEPGTAEAISEVPT